VGSFPEWTHLAPKITIICEFVSTEKRNPNT
jgi:hypothetical protein